ncbi:MAG: hypothetical protein WAT66_03110 [Actinomycetota bacterium]
MRGRIMRVGIVLGIILAATPLKAAVAGGGGCHEEAINVARESTVIAHNACFTPTIARVPVGTTVRWFNKDPFKHTVTGVNLSFGDLQEKGTDAIWFVKFDKPGVYPYYCYLHAGMVGSVVVGNDAQLVIALGKTGLDFPQNVNEIVTKTPVNPVADKTESTSVWPALAAGIGLASVGVGFGFGRRAGRNGHAMPSDS